MKTPQELAEEYAEKWNEGEPGDPDVAYTLFLAGYSVAMEQKWISVEDKLPYFNIPVIVFRSDKVCRITYLKSVGLLEPITKWHRVFESDNLKITHWQPLPSPPSQKENNLKTK